MTKAELRKIFLVKQKAILPEERVKSGAKIASLLLTRFDLSTITYLHCFLPIERLNEIDTAFIFEEVWQRAAHIRIVVPVVDFAEGELTSMAFERETQLATNRWGIREPVDRTSTVDPLKIDTVLVPGLCVDTRGHRVGYGRGFYDRLLARCRPDCLKIGLNYFPPVSEITDVWAQDIRLDHCITPADVRNF
jgi:5-formyltetrahydrofolate cyclo-ligase